MQERQAIIGIYSVYNLNHVSTYRYNLHLIDKPEDKGQGESEALRACHHSTGPADL